MVSCTISTRVKDLARSAVASRLGGQDLLYARLLVIEEPVRRDRLGPALEGRPGIGLRILRNAR